MNVSSRLLSAVQDALYFSRRPSWPPLLGLLGRACVLLSIGAAMFNRYKHAFAETL